MTAKPDGLRVLVVDDSDEVRTLIRRALTGHGYQVDVAASLAQARALDPAGYDALLVDAHLGAEQGADLIDALLAQDPAAASRCLMITGGSARAAPPGVACLAKPFRPGELISAVRALHEPGATQSVAVGAGAAAAGAVLGVGGLATAPAAGSSGPAGPLARNQPPGQAVAHDGHPRGGHPHDGHPRGGHPHDGHPRAGHPQAGHAAVAVGLPGRTPAPWRLLGMLRALRARERDVLADFVHDGPIQELAAAALALQLAGRPGGDAPAPLLAAVGEQIDKAARLLRYLTDGDWPFLPPGTALPDTIRQRAAWLPLTSVTVDIRHTCAALRAEAPLIADVVELALFLMTGDGPPGQAHVCVQAGDDEAEIVLTLTGAGAGGEGAAAREQLAELASILGGTAHTERGPARWQVRITLPRQCAVGDRRH